MHTSVKKCFMGKNHQENSKKLVALRFAFDTVAKTKVKSWDFFDQEEGLKCQLTFFRLAALYMNCRLSQCKLNYNRVNMLSVDVFLPAANISIQPYHSQDYGYSVSDTARSKNTFI